MYRSMALINILVSRVQKVVREMHTECWRSITEPRAGVRTCPLLHPDKVFRDPLSSVYVRYRLESPRCPYPPPFAPFSPSDSPTRLSSPTRTAGDSPDRCRSGSWDLSGHFLREGFLGVD